MKKYKILLSGNVNYIANTENQAIEYAEKDLKHIHSKYNVGILAISEVREKKQHSIARVLFQKGNNYE